ncbi:hypothetical protein BT96DRAFT_915133 [Gymnopus androsaceus JB14]|uniref:ERCC4 domain-containing protein n=1 Tax=Gymnopus androsaceus JB14 TaxID=1447944 RepID=A0A6A4I472_9AGAR|nr:hypothetical protein BT96DRAFT_915133 [Gymnopus androsaceus JB14]
MPSSDAIEISDSDTDIEPQNFSQATLPPSSQVYEISDDDDDEWPRATVPATSSPSEMVIDLPDDDDDDDDFSISSPQKAAPRKPQGKGKARALSPYYDSDSDLPDGVQEVLKSIPLKNPSSTSQPSYSNKRRYSQTTPHPIDLTDSYETPSPPKKTRSDKPSTSTTTAKKRTRKTAEEKAIEKVCSFCRLHLKRKRSDKAAHKTANKLVTDKKGTLKDMTIILSDSFKSYPNLAHLLHKKIDEFGATIAYERVQLPGYDTVRWQRLIKREYDVSTRAFKPVDPPYSRYENLALLRLAINQLRPLVLNDGLVGLLQDFRRTHGLEPKDQVFIMIIGMGRLRKSKPAEWNSLEFEHHTYHVCVEDEQEMVDRLYDYSADLGTLVARSHLPQGKGTDNKDTWIKMLTQIHRLTDPAAEGIVAEYPTMRRNPDSAQHLLANCKIDRRRDGQKTATGGGGDKVGQALSKRVYTVLQGTDHLELVFKDK